MLTQGLNDVGGSSVDAWILRVQVVVHQGRDQHVNDGRELLFQQGNQPVHRFQSDLIDFAVGVVQARLESIEDLDKCTQIQGGLESHCPKQKHYANCPHHSIDFERWGVGMYFSATCAQ